jgi:hypothetical protein
MADPTIAPIMDECIHLMTTAFCSICKANTRAAESRRRRTRANNHPSWETEVTLPYPSTQASYRSLCANCDEYMEVGTTIYKVEDVWVCQPCAEDCLTLGVPSDA